MIQNQTMLHRCLIREIFGSRLTRWQIAFDLTKASSIFVVKFIGRKCDVVDLS